MSAVNAVALLAAAGGDYQISRSVRLRSSASAYFNRTPASAGSRTTWTMSFWMKLGNSNGSIFGGASASNNPRMQFYYTASTGYIEWYQSDSGGGTVFYLIPNQLFRDPSAWYHILLVADTTQATSSNRLKWYVNGVQITSFHTSTYPAQNTNTEWNTNTIHNIGRQPNGGSYFDGYLTEINFIDGQALTPSSFGETDAVTGVWKPKKYAGTYGTNGFYLNFSDNSAATATTIGKDYSGNGNNWTPNNISLTAGVTYDSMLDVPTLWADGGNGRGNYCVLSPVDRTLTDGSITNGNLTLNGTSNWNACRATFGVSSGQWYWETVHSVYNQSICGIADSAWPTSTNYPGFSSTGYSAAYGQNAFKYVDGANSAYGATFTIGDVIGYALDMDAGTLTCYKNGVSQGTMVTGLTAYGTIFPAIAAANGAVINANFGQRPFAYTPPTGFKALNTQNLPDATIKKGGRYFNAVTYTGNGAARSITGTGFQPDFVWIKNRSSGSFWHQLYDSVRGALKSLFSNDTSSESTYTDTLTAFASDGFTLGTDAAFNGGVNKSGDSYVAWQWKESVSAGFDIVTYTGTASSLTVNHSLGVAPAMIIAKSRGTAGTNWGVWHKNLTAASYYLLLNSTAAQATAANTIQSTPTSTSVSLGDSSIFNAASSMVMYLFAEVAGYSKFGSYTGNGSSDGPFVYCGFRPRFVLVKGSSNASSWQIFDTSRSTYNQTDNTLWADLSSAEGTGTARIDLLSNGFKVRAPAGTDPNVSSATYIFMALAENPFKNSLAR